MRFISQIISKINHLSQRAIGLDANNDKAWLGMAFAYLHTDKDALAAAGFDSAMRINPANRDKLAPVLEKLSAR